MGHQEQQFDDTSEHAADGAVEREAKEQSLLLRTCLMGLSPSPLVHENSCLPSATDSSTRSVSFGSVLPIDNAGLHLEVE